MIRDSGMGAHDEQGEGYTRTSLAFPVVSPGPSSQRGYVNCILPQHLPPLSGNSSQSSTSGSSLFPLFDSLAEVRQGLATTCDIEEDRDWPCEHATFCLEP